MYTLELIDSWGKIPSGILRGHMRSLGNFEECVNVKSPTNNEFKGQYCTINLSFPKQEDGKQLTPTATNSTLSSSAGGLLQLLYLQFGICVPNVCNENILNEYLKPFIDKINTELENKIALNVAKCLRNEPYPKNSAFYISIVMFSIFAAVMLLSTIYDYTLSYNKKESLSPLFTAFSIKSNLKKLFRIENYNNSANVIECLNGIRCLSIIMVLFGHEYGFAMLLSFINAIDFKEWEKSPFSFIVRNGTLAVDTFFVLSGCLLIWAAFKEMEKTEGKLNILLMYFHRYIRLTPVLAMSILFAVGIYPHLGSGPFWDMTLYLPACVNNWWTTLLYVQNYVNPDTMCMPHTWYLAVDTQLYILSPIVLIPMYKFGIIGIIPGILGSIGSIIYVFITWMNNEFHIFIQEHTNIDKEREKLIYYTTHTRIPSYVIGIVLGFYLFKLRKNNTFKLSAPIVIIGWLASLSVMCAIIFGFYPKAQNLPNPTGIKPIEGAFFESLSRISWSIAIAWLIFACQRGYGGIINSFLSWNLWQPLARLSYSIYIIHSLVQMITIQMTKTDIHFSDFDMMLRFWTTFGFTCLFSTICVLAFELPILGIEKAIFTRKQKTNIV